MKTEIAKRAGLAAALAAASAFLACGEEEVTPSGPPYALTEPKYVLADVEYAFNHRDIELLDKCLADNFVFYFNPADVGDTVGDYRIPESWTKTDFLAASKNLFDQAYSISLNIDWEGIGSPASDGTEFYASNVQFDFTVMTDAINGYYATGYFNFSFRKLNSGTWRLIRWWDHTSGFAGGSAPASFGKILALYR